MPPIALQGPFAGQNEAVDASFLAPNEAESAVNCVLDDGTLRKRGGWQARVSFTDAGDGPIRGIYDYVRNDGVIITLVKSGTNLYAVTPTGTLWAAVKLNQTFSMSGATLASFATVNNRVYFCDGSLFKVTDGTNVFDVAITRPPSAPSISLSGAVGTGVLTGTYHYVYTYYSSTWGQESQSSNGSGAVTCDGQGIQVIMTNSTDGRMTVGGKLRVYRRKISANEQFFYLVAEIDQAGGATTTYIDQLLDNDVALRTTAPPTSIAVPTDVSYLALQGGILYISGSTSSPQTVWITRPNEPYVITGSIEVGSIGDSEKVRGVAAFRSVLVIFKENSIWILAGDSKETIYSQKVIPNLGCRSHHSIVYSEGLLYFLAHNGIYSFDGAQATRISDPIKRSIDNRRKDLDNLAAGALDADRGMILWCYASATASAPDLGAAYFYRNSARVGMPSWSPWEFQDTNMSFLSVVRDALTAVPQFVYGFDSGDLGTTATTAFGDNGQPVKFRWRTGKLALGRNDLVKVWSHVSFQCVPAPLGDTIDINVYKDDEGAPDLIVRQDMSDANVTRRVGHSARQLRLEVTNHNNATTEIVWLALEAEMLGRGA